MRKILIFLTSTKISMILLTAFAITMALATFIENDYGTQVARAQVYEAWWFESILIWLSINFIAHIKKYNLLGKSKWIIGVFHIAFIIIIIGSGITRYTSQEGNMGIREGETVNFYLSTGKYAQIKSEYQYDSKAVNIIPYSFSGISKALEVEGNKFFFKITKYLEAAKPEFIQGNDTIIQFAIAQRGERKDASIINRGVFMLEGNEYLNINLPNRKEDALSVFQEKGEWKLQCKYPLTVTIMSTQEISAVPAKTPIKLSLETLYQWEEGTFMVKQIAENKKQIYKEAEEKEAKMYPKMAEVVIENPEGNTIATEYFIVNNKASTWKSFKYNHKEYSYTFGPKKIQLPFALKLNKFEIERYPGSLSPSSYASNVQVIDNKENKKFDFRIFMNNVLDYKGYRFYQASYDADEKGTLLAVNKDWWGTVITYIGYTLLFAGMILTLFIKKSRFTILNQRLKKIKKTLFFFILLISGGIGNAQSIEKTIVPQEKAEAYGKLIVQDLDGRMKPITTLAYEIARKLNGNTTITIPANSKQYKLSPEQFLLAVQINPKIYGEIPLFKVDADKAKSSLNALNLTIKKYYAFDDLVTEKGQYILHNEVERINRLKMAERTEADKEILKLDERFNIFYGIVMGDFLRLYPNKDDDNNTWFTAKQSQRGFSQEDATFVQNIGNYYVTALSKAILSGDYKDADETLIYIDTYQREAGKEVYPPDKVIAAELFYTKTRIGNYLFVFFTILGTILLVVNIIKLFNASTIYSTIVKWGSFLAILGLLAFTFDLCLRWYIAKHPPWSDGFEMMLFVSWGILLFGLLFHKKSSFTLPVGLLFSGILLFVSFLDWLNPEITNLKPVLHSYWLKIHVAIIVASYAPLALSAVLALLSLMLLIFKPTSPTKRWWVAMQEMSIVNEMAITIGLFLLTIGTFLGGIWANESWGRYWAWDPKETWALISIMVYSLVLHLRLIPKMASALMYNLSSLWAFSSIIMTSYGVNYYLSGLHSYAKGDPVPIPAWVYWVVVFLLIISIFATAKFYRLPTTERKKLR